ncbi:MAG: amidohydrolase family protein [Candidatus Binataceae bacterium]
MATYQIISADSHMTEPPGLWTERLDRKYRDHAPKVVDEYEGKKGAYFVAEGLKPFPVGGIFGSGKTAEELPAHFRKGYEAAPKSVWEPAERLKEQDRDSVKAEVLYTSLGMFLYGLEDAELRSACFSVYNDFVAEYCKYNPKRLVGLGLVTLEKIEDAVKELERCAKKGLRGAMIWASPPDERPYTHPDYKPFWTAAERLDLPISLHILTGRRGSGIGGRRNFLSSYLAVPHGIQDTLGTMIFGGVLEEFPQLKLISAESDVTWFPHFMYRLDHAYDRFRHFQGVTLALKPSEYVRRQVYATFQFETIGRDLVDAYGVEQMMWSSDYPHTDSPWPHSREYIEGGAFARITPAETQKIVAGNAAKLYHIPLS